MHYSIRIIYSNRKTIGFEIKEENVLTVRAPYQMSEREILQHVERHHRWIDNHMQHFKETSSKTPEAHFTREEIRAMADQALLVIPPRVKELANKVGVTYGRITIRNQKTRWGSCSAKGNLNFNCLLMLVPQRVLDYVIIHELCHRLEMNHSSRFWQLVEQHMPDYREQKLWLKEHGHELIERL